MPEYAGSAIRGALGHALKDMACFSARFHRGHCQCLETEGCLYQQLFDPLPRQCQALQLQYDAAPPLIVQAHHLPEQLSAQETAHFDIMVLGQHAITQWPIIQLALQRALMGGIGWRHPQRGRAQLTQVETLPVESAPNPIQSHSMHIQLLGHTRLQHQGQILVAEDWQPEHWLKAALRRQTLMRDAYQLALPDIHWPDLQTDVTAITWRNTNLHDVDWTRYSNRQQQTMPLNGVGGEFVLEQVSPALQALLHYGQWLHVGKNSIFGLGQYQIASSITGTA